MTEPAFAITWEAGVSGLSGGALGVWVVTGEDGYVPATTVNYTIAPAIHGICISEPNQGRCTIQHTGPVPSTVTGFSASASGFARLNLSTGRAEFVAAYSSSDIKLGPVDFGLLRIDYGGDSASSGNYSPLLATELDEDAADNSAALTAFCDRVDAGRTGIIPAGTYYFTNTAFGLYENGFRGITIEGESDGTQSGTGGVKFVWNGARVSGSAASLECLHKGVVDPTYTWTHFDYVRLSGITGATAASVGKRYLVGNTARSYWAQVAICVAVESATSIVLGMYYASSNVSIVGDTDANNGAITWEEYNPLWSIRGRDITIRGIEFATAGGSTRKPSALLEWSQSDDASVATHLQLDNLFFISNDNISKARACVDVGRVILPNSNSSYYLLEGGYRRPFVPYQCDYMRMLGCTFYFQDVGITSGNPTGQERANAIYSTDFVGMSCGVSALSWFTNAAEQALRPASICFDFMYCQGGTISDTFLKTLNPNAQNTMYGCYFEGPMYRLAVGGDGIGGAGMRPLMITNCFFDVTDFATDATGWLFWLNGPLTISGGMIRAQGAPGFESVLTGFKIVFKSGNYASGSVSDCILPAESEIGADLFQLTGAYSKFSRQNCVEWDVSGGTMNVLTDKDYVGLLTTEGGKYLQKVKGISKTWTAANNLWGSVTITGAATSQAVLFGTGLAEVDGNFQIIMTAADSTGTPAAGSYTPKPATSKATTGFTANCEVAPGVGNSVTFTWMLLR